MEGQTLTVAVENSAIAGILTTKLTRKRLKVAAAEVQKVVAAPARVNLGM